MPPDPRILERNVAKLVGRSYRAALPKPAFRAALKDGVIALASEPRLHRVERATSRPVARWLAIAAGIALAALLWRAFAPPPAPESLEALLARGAVALRDDPQGSWRAAQSDRIVVPAARFLEARTPAALGTRFTIEAIAGRCDLLASSHAEVATAAGGAADAPPLQVWLHAGHAQIATNARDRVVTKEGSITFGPGSLDVRYERNESVTDIPRLPVRLRMAEPGSGDLIVDDATPPQALDESIAWMLFERSARPWDADAPMPVDVDVTRRETAPDADLGAPARLDDPGLLRAHVVDARTKLPLPRVRVTLLPIEKIFADGRRVPAYGAPVKGADVDTDAGDADLYVESHGVYKLFVSAPGYATWQSERFESSTDAAAKTFAVALEAGVSLAGTVVDAVTGDPLADAIVFSETDTPALGVPVSMEWFTVINADTRLARTDTAGRFTLDHASRVGQRLRAMSPGHGAQILRFDDFPVGASRADVRFELGPSGAVAGRVLDIAGKPVASQLIVAVSQTQRGEELAAPIGFSVTGDDGSYRIDELGPGLWIVIHMAAADPNTSSQRVRSARVAAGQTATANFGGGAHLVRGIARSPNGTPLVEATLSLAHEDDENSDTGQWIGVTTDAEGRFSTGLDRAGRYGVVLVENAGQRISMVGSFVVTAELVTEVDLRMPTGVISGRAVKTDSGDAVPHAHVIVLQTALDGTTSFAGHTVADANGRFETAPFAVEGTYSIVSFSSDEPLGLGFVRGVQVTAGQSATGIELRMPRGGSIVVAPQDATGAPIATAFVDLVDARGMKLESDFMASISPLGEKRFPGVDAARWTVFVRADGYEPLETTCDVPLDGEVRVIARLVPAAK